LPPFVGTMLVILILFVHARPLAPSLFFPHCLGACSRTQYSEDSTPLTGEVPFLAVHPLLSFQQCRALTVRSTTCSLFSRFIEFAYPWSVGSSISATPYTPRIEILLLMIRGTPFSLVHWCHEACWSCLHVKARRSPRRFRQPLLSAAALSPHVVPVTQSISAQIFVCLRVCFFRSFNEGFYLPPTTYLDSILPEIRGGWLVACFVCFSSALQTQSSPWLNGTGIGTPPFDIL